MRTLDRESIVSIFLLLFCGFLIWAGRLIRDPQFGELPPAAWPQGVTYVLTAFCLFYFFQSIMRYRAAQPAEEPDPEVQKSKGLKGWFDYYRNPIICFALYFGFLITLPFLGTLIGGSLLVFLLMTVLGGAAPRQLVLHAVIAVLSVGAMWSVFTFGLRVLLPRGEILPGI